MSHLPLNWLATTSARHHSIWSWSAFDNPLDAIEFLAEAEAELIFADIQMLFDLTGHRVHTIAAGGAQNHLYNCVRKICPLRVLNSMPLIIFKPFSYEEFLKAAGKAHKIAELEASSCQQLRPTTSFFLKSEYKIRRINFNDILYIEGLKDYIKVYTTGEDKPVLSLNSIKSLEQKLPEEKFMRVHRSFLVNLDKIETIDRSRIVFGKAYIPVSDQYKAKFQEYL